MAAGEKSQEFVLLARLLARLLACLFCKASDCLTAYSNDSWGPQRVTNWVTQSFQHMSKSPQINTILNLNLDSKLLDSSSKLV